MTTLKAAILAFAAGFWIAAMLQGWVWRRAARDGSRVKSRGRMFTVREEGCRR